MTPTKAGAQGARPLPRTRPDELIRQCLSTLASEPKDVSSLVGLMQACLSLGAWEEVAYTARRLLAVVPTHPEAQAHLAMLQALEGDAKAVERLKSLASRAETGFHPRFDLGIVLDSLTDTAGAKAAFESARKVEPQNPQAYFELGKSALQEQDWATAISRFQEAARLAPQSGAPCLLLARAHVGQGRLDLAVKAAVEAHQREPAMVEPLEDLYSYLMVGEDLDHARKIVRELRRRAPSSTDYLYKEALLELRSLRHDEARRLLMELLQWVPESWQARQALAKVHVMQGRKPEALKLLEEATALAPKEPGPANDLAQLLMRGQSFARAREVLQRVLAEYPDHADTHLNLAIALARSAREPAQRHAEKALELGTPEVQEQASRLLTKLRASA
jgi:Flp pilus assembly protein TadD